MRTQAKQGEEIHQSVPPAPKRRKTKIEQAEPLIQIGNKIYKLTPTMLKDLESSAIAEIKAKIERQLQRAEEMVRQYQYECDRKIRAVQEQSSCRIMPPTERFMLENGMLIAENRGMIEYILPFKYAPKYVGTGGQTYKILHPEKLVRNVFVKFVWQPDGRGKLMFNRSPELIHPHGERFSHYHNGCWGDFSRRMPSNPKVTDLPKLRDDLQQVLENITHNDTANGHPHGLPAVTRIAIDREHKMVFSKTTPPRPTTRTRAPISQCPACRCQRCGHRWQARTPSPSVCPQCRGDFSRYGVITRAGLPAPNPSPEEVAREEAREDALDEAGLTPDDVMRMNDDEIFEILEDNDTPYHVIEDIIRRAQESIREANTRSRRSNYRPRPQDSGLGNVFES